MLNGNNSFYQNMFTSIQNGEGEFLMDTNAPNLTTKDITENGTYNASDDNADGYSSVTVNVPAPTPETFEVEIEYTNGGVTINKTYQQIKSEMDLGKTISGTANIIIQGSSEAMLAALSNSYIKDFYGTTATESDAIFIVTESFLFSPSPETTISLILAFVVAPDNKVYVGTIGSWSE